MEIGALTAEDKEYLQEFIKCELLDMGETGLRALANMPDIETLNVVSSQSHSLRQLLLQDNCLTGEDLQELQIYRNLKELDLSNNQVADLELLKPLVSGELTPKGRTGGAGAPLPQGQPRS